MFRLAVMLYTISASIVYYVVLDSYSDLHDKHVASYNTAIASLAQLSADQQRIDAIITEKENLLKVIKARAKYLDNEEMNVFLNAIVKYSQAHGFDPYLLLAVVETESSYRQYAISNKGAVGLMQVRPFVARDLANELHINADSPSFFLCDLDLNVRLGAYYLAKMTKQFGGDLSLALEAYNMGPGKLKSFLRKGAKLSKRYASQVNKSRSQMKNIARRSLA